MLDRREAEQRWRNFGLGAFAPKELQELYSRLEVRLQERKGWDPDLNGGEGGEVTLPEPVFPWQHEWVEAGGRFCPLTLAASRPRAHFIATLGPQANRPDGFPPEAA